MQTIMFGKDINQILYTEPCNLVFSKYPIFKEKSVD